MDLRRVSPQVAVDSRLGGGEPLERGIEIVRRLLVLTEIETGVAAIECREAAIDLPAGGGQRAIEHRGCLGIIGDLHQHLRLGNQQPGVVRLSRETVVERAQSRGTIAAAGEARHRTPQHDRPCLRRDLAHFDDVLLAVGFPAKTAEQKGANAEIESAIGRRELRGLQDLVQLIQGGVLVAGRNAGQRRRIARCLVPLGTALELGMDGARQRQGRRDGEGRESPE